jgi:WD40 repeat protein
MRILVLVLPLALLAAAPPADRPKVRALIEQLGADTFAEREAASKTLLKIGPPALTPLRKALFAKDLEVRRRARRLVDAIEKEVYGIIRVFEGHSGGVNGVAFSPDGRRAASADGRAVRLWDLATGKQLARTEEHDDRVIAVCFSPDGRRLASASEDRTVRLWDARTLEAVRIFRGHRDYVRAVTFSHRGKRLVSASMDGTIREWETDTGKPRRVVMRGLKNTSMGLALDGKVIVAAGVGSAKPTLWDLDRSDAQGELVGHGKQVLGVCISRDGKQALSAGHDHTVRVWDLALRKCVYTLEGHMAEVSCVAISQDGTKALSGGVDKAVRVWDLTTGTAIRELTGHTKPVWCVAISPDGTRALSGANDGTMRLWSVGVK